MKDIYIGIYSVDMGRTYVSEWFRYASGTNVLDILRDIGLEIEDGKTAATCFTEGTKKTVFVTDAQGFKFVCTFKTKCSE